MPAAAKKQATKAKEAPVIVTIPEPEAAPDVEKAAEKLIGNVSEVSVTISGFGTSVKIDDDMASEMLKPTEADKHSVSLSKKLFKSNHPAMKAFKEAKKAIDEHVHAWTVPDLALRIAAGSLTSETSAHKDPGIRLIEKKNMKAFDERLQYLISLLRSTTQQLQEKMPEIKMDEQDRLGKLYKESDYPADITKSVGVTVRCKPAGVDLDWKTLCPAIYERERLAARKKFEAVVENAAVEFADRFVKYVKQVTDQIGNRTRLRPIPDQDSVRVIVPEGSGTKEVLVSCKDAEVLATVRHEDEPSEVPVDHVLLQLRLAKKSRGKSTEVWLAEPILLQHYHDVMRPYSTEERRKLYSSTIDNLKQEMEAFLHIGAMLGPYQEIISGSVSKVKEMLGKAASNLDSEKIASALREGDYFRNEMKTALEGVIKTVESNMGEVATKRRTFKKGLIGKVGAD